jgi:tRNA threonylcarbamoyladenosine biosynthesis protein TsaE
MSIARDFAVTHLSDNSQPPATSHWGAELEDAAATERLGAKLAPCLNPGMRIYLRGELGSGKTTLVRGLLRALGVLSGVRSPSYSLVEPYVVSRLHLYHFDFYRFNDPGELRDAGLAEHFRGDGVCLVEWPERASGQLPPPDLEIVLGYSGTARTARIAAVTDMGVQCLGRLRED